MSAFPTFTTALTPAPLTNLCGQPPICAVQYLRPMRGGSQSKLLRASDGAAYVTKFQGNPQGTRILVNEMLAGSIGQRLRLPVPHLEIIEVPDSLIEDTPELCFDSPGEKKRPSCGLHLGSRYLAGPGETVIAEYLPEDLAYKIANLDDFTRCTVLDKWTGNADGRQAVFVQVNRQPEWHCWLVDQGYCFNASAWDFPDLALHGVYYRNWVYKSVVGWQSFEPALSLAETMDIDELWECTRRIPPEWYESNSSELHRLIEELHKRRSLIRNLLTAFRGSMRAPFPNWVC